MNENNSKYEMIDTTLYVELRSPKLACIKKNGSYIPIMEYSQEERN